MAEGGDGEGLPLEASFRFQLGSLLVDSARSPLAMARLPARLARLIQHYRRRNRSIALIGALECGQGLGRLQAAAMAEPLPMVQSDELFHALRSEQARVRPLGQAPGWAFIARGLIEDYKRLLREGPSLPEPATSPALAPQDEHVLAVLHSSLVGRVNGYGMRSHHLLGALQARGWSVSAAVRQSRPGETLRDGLRYTGLGLDGGPENLEALLAVYSRRIEALARALRPSLIHAASNFITGLAALRAARRLGLPFVYEVRGLWHVTRASHTPAFAGSLSYRLQDRLECAVVRECDLDGIVATNTTTERPETLQSPARDEDGGLSGAPLEARATEMVRFVAERTDVPVIGVGGVSDAAGAYAKIRAGASLVQLYTALVYEGPGVAREINEGLLDLLERDGFDSVEDAVGADL